jgi:crotonobetainyl-CoA:carnitine CoA-transferase CaiB-like acyl-CoA transferase
MPHVLEGIRVVEVAALAATPSATAMLADLGVEAMAATPSN